MDCFHTGWLDEPSLASYDIYWGQKVLESNNENCKINLQGYGTPLLSYYAANALYGVVISIFLVVKSIYCVVISICDMVISIYDVVM